MLISPNPMAETATVLRSGQLDLLAYIDDICNRIDAAEPHIHALLPEPERRVRLIAGAKAFEGRFSEPPSRPPLYGISFCIKDIFHVDGFLTRAGSRLPSELFSGSQT